ncbi:MAG: ABC transporter ATP-binding protein [Deltaproteobacteria bacterium]|nr:ABC transporter ATP-binding protein [Deltaproteobacteria bacterium]
MNPLVEVNDVTKTFNAGRQNEFTALRNITLTIPGDMITVLKGPSGSGKTTLLSLIGCMARPTSGRIRLKDRETTSLPERFLSAIRRQTYGFIFQNFNLIKGMTVLDNVMIPAYPTGRPYKEVKEAAIRNLERLKIAGKANQKVEHLSGGEQQRVAIARALINDPEIIIADEPTAHLDSELARNILEILWALKTEGKPAIITSHDPIVCESDVVDHLVEMRDGRLVDRKFLK